MQTKKQPGNIKFYEEPRENISPFSSSKLTRAIRWCSFGILKTDTQASIGIVVVVVVATLVTIQFVQERETVIPTTQFELLPQETVGSHQGLPARDRMRYE